MKYSATTVMMPHLDMEGQAKLLSKLGYDGMELRVRYCSKELAEKKEPSNWGYHCNEVDPDDFASKAPYICKVLEDNGLQLAGLATNMTCQETEVFKKVLDGAVIAKAPFIRLGESQWYENGNCDYWKIYGDTVAGYAECLRLAKGSGVKILLEMHGRTIHSSASLAYRILSNFSPNDVGVIYDPQNMVMDGYETPEVAFQLLGDYVAHCHFGGHKPVVTGEPDANGSVQWGWAGCSLAEGFFNFTRLYKILKKINYSHFITVEDFRGEPKAEVLLEEGINYLKKVEASTTLD